MSGSRVREDLGRMAVIEIELMTLGAFLRKVLHRVVNRLATDNTTRVCGNGDVLIRVSQGTFRQWFATGFFRVLRGVHCNPTLASLAVARLAELDCDATGVEWFPFENERSQLIFILPAPGMTLKRADGTQVTDGGNDEIRPVYREKFADHRRSRDFSERLGSCILRRAKTTRIIRCCMNRAA